MTSVSHLGVPKVPATVKNLLYIQPMSIEDLHPQISNCHLHLIIILALNPQELVVVQVQPQQFIRKHPILVTTLLSNHQSHIMRRVKTVEIRKVQVHLLIEHLVRRYIQALGTKGRSSKRLSIRSADVGAEEDPFEVVVDRTERVSIGIFQVGLHDVVVVADALPVGRRFVAVEVVAVHEELIAAEVGRLVFQLSQTTDGPH